MKIKNLVLLALLLACVPLMAKTVKLHGTVTGLPQGTALNVMEAVGNKLEMREQLTLPANGKFATAVEVEKNSLFVLQPEGVGRSVIHVMVESKDRDLELNISYNKDYNILSLESAKGSKNATLYKMFNNAVYGDVPAMKALNEEFTAQGTAETRKQAISNELHQLQLKQRMAVKRLIMENSDCLMAAFLVTYFDEDQVTYIDVYEKVLQSLGKDYSGNVFVENVAQKVAVMMKEGSLAPEIAMKDKDGKERKLSSLRGKVVLIDFWASWCGPCRAELPNVVRLYQKYKDKGFEIYSVSLDKDRNAWLNAIASTGQVWENHVSDLNGWTSSGGKAYGVSSIPYTVLIDRQGRVIAKKLRGEELAMKLAEIFGE